MPQLLYLQGGGIKCDLTTHPATRDSSPALTYDQAIALLNKVELVLRRAKGEPEQCSEARWNLEAADAMLVSTITLLKMARRSHKSSQGSKRAGERSLAGGKRAVRAGKQKSSGRTGQK